MTNQSILKSQSLEDWLFYLESQHHKEIDLGLTRIIDLAKDAGLANLGSAKVVLVAGTNGKGTTIRFLEQYLLSLGHSVGVYGSPHMHVYNERVRINGEMLSDEDHIGAFRFIEDVRADKGLTFFEFGTLAAFKLLKDANLDFALIEVGLGGRLDATNILSHDVSVITTLGMDHTDWLGDTIEQIGFEKAGIFRANKPGVVGLADAPATVFEQAENLSVSSLAVRGKDFDVIQNDKNWDYVNGDMQIRDLPNTLIPHQNIATGLTALMQLGILPEQAQVQNVLQRLSLPGRMQIVSEQPLCMVDVAHNAHAVKYLVSQLESDEKLRAVSQRQAVIAMMADKDINNAIAEIAPLIEQWHVAPLVGNPRAATVQELVDIISTQSDKPIKQYATISDAWQGAKQEMNHDGLLLGFGSFYTVAEILK